MKILLLTFALVSARAGAQDIHCLGPEADKAEKFFVFLHGAGKWEPKGYQHRVLERVARAKKMRISVPVSEIKCTAGDYQGKPCWFHDPRDENGYHAALRVIEKAADKCFPEKAHGLMGLSNGANLTLMLARACAPNSFTELIAIAGQLKFNETQRSDLKNCTPPLKILSGLRDPLLPEVQRTYETLKERGYPVSYEEFRGGHDLKFDALMKLF